MLIKIIFNSQNRLIKLNEKTLEEFVIRSKSVFNIDGLIRVEYSNCEVDDNLFQQILESFGNNKDPIAFVIHTCGTETNYDQNSQVSGIGSEYTSVEYLEENLPGIPIETVSQDANPFVNGNILLIPANETEEDEAIRSNQPTNQKRQATVNPKITSIVFEEIFEIQKSRGSISSGQLLESNDRVSASKAVIRKVLAVAGLDYM